LKLLTEWLSQKRYSHCFNLKLVNELKKFHRPNTAFFYPNEGHDTDRINAPVTTRKFIAAALGVK